MALINCSECNTNVSSEAKSCPSCGKILKKVKRGIFGKLIKYTFIFFNILMLIWLISAMGTTSEVYQSADSEAGQAGAAIGAGIGFVFILIIWALGTIVLGLATLLTRPK